MALRHAVMAALLEGEASGYDLAKSFDASLANFWMATPQQVYRELERMEIDGLVQARVVEQERRPNKRLFALTDAGHEALHRFTVEPVKPGAIREDLLVKVQAVDAGDVQAVTAALEARLEWSRTKVTSYDRLRARLLDGRAEDDYVMETDRIGPYLTLLRGRAFEQENIRWLEQCLDILRRRAAR